MNGEFWLALPMDVGCGNFCMMWEFLFYYFEFIFTNWYQSYWFEILALAITKFEVELFDRENNFSL